MGLVDKPRIDKIYVSINDENFTKKCKLDDGMLLGKTPTKRDWKNEKAGTSGTSIEYQWSNINGMRISSIKKNTLDFGAFFNIELVGNEDEPIIVISIKEKSQYAKDFLKKLPNIKLDSPCDISLFSFKNDEGYLQQGFNINQGYGLLKNFFVDKDKNLLHGYPKHPGKDAKQSLKEIHKIQELEFLEEYMIANILPELDMIDDKPSKDNHHTVKEETYNTVDDNYHSEQDESSDLPF